MLIDGIRFDEIPAVRASQRAVASFVSFLEKKLGFTALFDKRRIPYGRTDLIEPLEVAGVLMRRGIIDRFDPADNMPDEPPIRLWSCRLTDEGKNSTGGSSSDDDKPALFAALAEALERYLWWTQTDYFRNPRRATHAQMAASGRIVTPEQFAGFSEAQRNASPEIGLRPDTTFLWIEGRSLVSGENIFIPAQTASAAHRPWKESEPLIREQITIGLATWPTQAGARLSGALECIEREAYMVMWFNQFTYPRASLPALRRRSPSLDKLASRCERYGLRIHIIPMVTDAPTHAVVAIVEDESPVGPRFAFGLKAHRSLPHAAEEATLEALRARRFTRREPASRYYDPKKPVHDIGHRGRVYYWWEKEHTPQLEFLLAGEEREFEEAPWEQDDIDMHLKRVIEWCGKKGYECISVPFTASRSNPMPWHIEMIVMPDLQWTHVREKWVHLGGVRLTEIPRSFGYEPRSEPFIDAPHPYC